MSKTEKPEAATQAAPAAPAVDPSVELLGRFNTFHREMLAALAEQTKAIEALTERVGELSIGAPMAAPVEQVPLTRAQIEEALRKRPAAAFRLLQDVSSPSFNRAKGSIIRPQVLDATIWRQLLGAQVRMADADEHP